MKFVVSLNALVPIVVTPVFKFNFSNAVHPENASFPIVVIFPGNLLFSSVPFFIFVNDVHPLNALFPIVIHVDVALKVTVFIAVHPSNAESSIPVIVLAIVTEVTVKLLKLDLLFHSLVTVPVPVIFKVVPLSVYFTVPIVSSAAYVLDSFILIFAIIIIIKIITANADIVFLIILFLSFKLYLCVCVCVCVCVCYSAKGYGVFTFLVFYSSFLVHVWFIPLLHFMMINYYTFCFIKPFSHIILIFIIFLNIYIVNITFFI